MVVQEDVRSNKTKSEEKKKKHSKKSGTKKKSETYKKTERTHDVYEKRKEKRDYEYVYSKLPEELKNCCFGDEYFFYEGDEGKPKYEDINEKWKIFEEWVESIRQKKKEEEGFDDSYPDRVGHEIVRWAKKHDVYAIFLIIEFHWVIFRDTYLLVEGCPEIVLEFVRGILYGKRTEEEMWGPPEARAVKGKLIVFDKKHLPKEGQDTGDLEVIYQPIECPPEHQGMDNEPCPIQYYPREKGLLPKIPLVWER